ncbi:30S ribosome-binding factor RbfA [Microvirga tunisiensis]|uniref:Ribosome-binding factor A n=2 Tax=Pannonibacter tanglangensis TaxID=2750084 RepID=A0A7X5F5A6_9HYPH|nr:MULTISPECIES: 30S ribosome-binding factor RbfA [unclassified Pannonibacter]NBN65756.1 30S ribosome-binding factor RbfA [Pannonibacter sp. XCT-34]NBN80017.1 30S ribosome-binding factor RbfA [Pannonibacter sp. XCT-53]
MAKSMGEGPGMPSQRQLRVGELVRKELSDIFTRGQLSDPDLDGVIITIPEVRMTPDLRLATCLVMPLGGRNADKVVKALNRSAKFFRGQVSRKLTMKYMPDFRFILDTRFDDDDRIGTLLMQPEVKRDLDAIAEDETDDRDD